MKQILTLLVVLFAISGVLSAQPFLSCEASPSEVAPGGTVNLSIEASVPIDLFSGCALVSVHQGSPTGPVVYSPFICPSIFITVGPGAPWTSAGWPTSPMEAPGDYFIKILGSDPATMATVECNCPVRVVAPASVLPVLSRTTGPVMNGSTVALSIASPGTPNAVYVVAASLTTNVGQTLSTTQHLALDSDILYSLSIPGPNPLFNNQIGMLDGAGNATASMLVPASPLIQGWPLAFQGAVISGSFAEGFASTTPMANIIH